MSRSRVHFFLLLFLAFTSIAGAQTATTSLRGIVTDKMGAVVGGVNVTLTESSVGFAQARTTNAQGEYNFQQIPPGFYTIKTKANGFDDQTTRVQLLVNQPATVNITLVVGGSETTVAVTAAPASLNQTDATIGTPFSQAEIQTLPFQGNNVLSLLALQPGVLSLGDQSNATMDSDSRAGAVNGARSDQGNVTLDGIDNNTQTQGYAFEGVLRPTRDSVEEFRVVTTSSNADSGRSSGAQISVVTRSGTNALHGSLYEYYRPSNTVSNDWFIKQAQLASGQPNIPGKYIRNTYGVSLGGPIIKDKLFYFASYEGDKKAQNIQETREVPLGTPASPGLRQGYVTYVNAKGGTTTLNPTTIAAMDPNCTALGTCPLGNGVDPAALAYFATIPQANGSLLGDGYNFGSYTFSSPNPQSLVTNIVKFDYNINSKQRLFVRGDLQSDNATGPVQYPGGTPATANFDNSKGIGIGHTWTITDSMVNSLRYGYIRQGFANRGALNGNYVDFANIDPLNATTTTLIVNVPVHNVIDDFTWSKKTHTFQAGANYRLIHNNRQSNATAFNNAQVQYYSLGAGSIANTGNSLDPSGFPSLGLPNVAQSFDSAYSNAIAAVAGVIPTATEFFNYKVEGGSKLSPLAPGPLTRNFKSNELEYYFQDSWKARRDLTITYGLRHTLLQTPYEVNGQEVAPTFSLHNWFLTRGAKMVQGITDQPEISFTAAGKANNAPGLWSMDKFDIAPRFAFAYSPSGLTGILGKIFGDSATSIRGGWGIYYDHFGEGIVDTFDANGAYGLSSEVRSPIDLTPDQAPRFASTSSVPTQIIPSVPQPTGFPVTPGDISALTWTVDDKVKTPYSQAIDLSIQRQITNSWTMEAAYVGRLGRRLLQNLDLATPLDLVDTQGGGDYFKAAQKMSALAAAGTATSAILPIPYFEHMFPNAVGNGNTATQNIYNDLWQYSVGNETYPLYALDNGYYPGAPNGKLNRYFDPQYASLYAWSGVGTSSYHSFQISAHHSGSNGLQLDFSYVLSKSIDLGSDTERTDFNKGQNFSSIVNAWNIQGNRGVSDFDTTHSVEGNWGYLLPFGRGAKFASTVNPVVNGLIGGWDFSGLTHWTSGLPFSPVDGLGWSTDWAIQSYDVLTGPVKSGGHRIINGQPNAFKSQATALSNIRPAYAGETGQRNAFRGDGYLSIDASLAKTFPIMQKQALKFQWDVFNTTNAVRFDPASVQNNPFSAGSFGVYSRTLVESRKMQLSLRYSF